MVIHGNTRPYQQHNIPCLHSSKVQAQIYNEARCLIYGRTLLLLLYFISASSEGSSETARMNRLVWAYAGRLCGKYHNLMDWLI